MGSLGFSRVKGLGFRGSGFRSKGLGTQALGNRNVLGTQILQNPFPVTQVVGHTSFGEFSVWGSGLRCLSSGVTFGVQRRPSGCMVSLGSKDSKETHFGMVSQD